MGSIHKPHVALVAFPYGTHAPPLFSLARAIAAACPTVIVSFISTKCSLEPFKKALEGLVNLKLIEMPDGLPSAGFVPSGHVLKLIGLFLSAMPGNLESGLKVAEEKAGGVKVTCVLSDAFLSVAGDVAKGMGVLWVALWTGGTAALSSHLYTDLIRLIHSSTVPVDFDIASKDQDVVLSFVPGLHRHRITDLPEGIVSDDINSPMSILLHQMGLNLPRATAVCLNTIEGLEPAIDNDFLAKFTKYLPIGPLHLLAPEVSSNVVSNLNKCLAWLDNQEESSVAYISFGSMMTPSPIELVDLASALASTDVPFLWSLKEASREHLPENFLKETWKRGMVVSWVPQQEVLGHPAVGVLVTHGGWNSVMEAVSAGVPMVFRPFFADQKMNARSVAEVWKIGVMLEGGAITKDGILSAFKEVLKGEEGERMRERAGDLKNIIVASIAKNGTSAKNFDTLVELIIGS